MSVGFYVPPEQLIKDRSDFARAGVAKGRPVVIASCEEGIVLVTDNSSQALRKISEIYDRIAFAGVGRYSEFEALRVAGIRYADLRGYAYDRADVSARAVAAAYAQTLGAIFTGEPKPLEVELAVAEVGAEPAADQVFRVSFDGSVSQETGITVIGGDGEQVRSDLVRDLEPGPTMAQVLAHTVAGKNPGDVEAALLTRNAGRRSFSRLSPAQLAAAVTGD